MKLPYQRFAGALFSTMLCLGWLAGNTRVAHATIYVCTDPQGHQTFTDRSCPEQRLYQPQPVAPLIFTPLSSHESKQLQALNKRTAQLKQARQKSVQQDRKRHAKVDGLRRQSCEQATSGLRALADRRRRGYPLSIQHALDASEAELRQQKRHLCH